MAKSASLRKILSFVIWLTGIIVSLSVAFAMADGTLALPKWLGGEPIALIAGWVVIITTVLGVVLAIIDYLT
ncbi:hypothetical protein J4466_04060 [Candidatus Pacearchaeota archaeon]|nr:hypothetical protein [Candidatus Pacearchaeota archaeon]